MHGLLFAIGVGIGCFIGSLVLCMGEEDVYAMICLVVTGTVFVYRIWGADIGRQVKYGKEFSDLEKCFTKLW